MNARATVRYPSMRERLLANVELIPFCSCWIWTGRASRGRGGSLRPKLNVRGPDGKTTTLNAHRVSHEVFKGPLGDAQAGHVPWCCSTLCIAPHHLGPQTQAQNMRQENARRKHHRRSK